MTLKNQTLAAAVADEPIEMEPRGDAPSPFKKITAIGSAISKFMEGRINPLSVRLDEVLSPTEAMIFGRRTKLFGTNNYLGLNFDPECRAAATEALAREGTGTTASRVASGNYAGHEALEREIAEFMCRRSAIVFSTGFQANLGVISGITGPGDVLVIDRDCHASIYDGCKLSGARIVEFRHNDPEDLERKIEELDLPGDRIFIIVEGLYSVAGDIAPLAEFAAIKRRFGAYLIVDEAHSFGTCGAHGRGASESEGVEADVDIVIGTFSKSVGVIGGFAASDHPSFGDLRLLARSYLYTASLPPPVVAAARASIRRIGEGDDLRDRLWSNARRLHAALGDIGYDLLAEPGPVIGIRAPGINRGYDMWHTLLQKGVYLNFLVPPSTPNGSVVLRCSLSAEHTDEQIAEAIEAFGETWRAVLGNGKAGAHSIR